MDVALISTPVDEALERLEDYLTSPLTAQNAEYRRIAEAYQQLAKGTPLIVLSDVIAQAPRDEKGRPRLAIARADQRQIKYSRFRREEFERFEATGNWRRRNQMAQGLWIRARIVPDVTPKFPKPYVAGDYWSNQVEGYSLVPIVPPAVRKRAKGPPRALNTHFILWEVERWADTEIAPQPDRDPYLLQRIADDLFAVVGEWDLTDVERAIMRDRARPR